MFCKFCGNQVSDTAAFCMACGHAIERQDMNNGVASSQNSASPVADVPSGQTTGLPMIQAQTLGLPTVPTPSPVVTPVSQPAPQPAPQQEVPQTVPQQVVPQQVVPQTVPQQVPQQAPVMGMNYQGAAPVYPNAPVQMFPPLTYPLTYQTPTVSTVAKHKVNILGLIASLILLISIFLPYASITYLRDRSVVSLIDAKDCVYFFILCAAGIGFSLPGIDVGTLITGIVSLLFSTLEAVMLFNYRKDLFDLFDVSPKGEVGMYLTFVGSALLLVAGIVGMVMRDKRTKKLREQARMGV